MFLLGGAGGEAYHDPGLGPHDPPKLLDSGDTHDLKIF